MKALHFHFDQFDDYFSISKTGTLDYIGCTFDHALFSSTDIPLVQENWEGNVHELYVSDCSVSLLCDDDTPAVLDVAIHGFCQRYPAFALAMERGDYLCASRILLRSSKLRPYVHLVSFIFRDTAFWPLLMSYLFDSSSTAAQQLDDVLERKAGCDAAYDVLYKFATFHAPLPFAHAKAAAVYFEEHIPDVLQIPVVGTWYHTNSLKALFLQVGKVYDVLLEKLIAGELSQAQFRDMFVQRIHDLFSIALVPEPSNAHDPYAIAVMITGPDGSAYHAGYLRKTIARLVDSSNLKASIASITNNGFDLFLGKK